MVRFTARAARMAGLTVLFGIFVSSAFAQQGRFTLPFDAQWGSVTLPAGEYGLALPLTLSGPQVVTISGNGRRLYVLATNEADIAEGEGSFLEAVNVGGREYIRSFEFGNTGKLFLFAVPKAAKVQFARTPEPNTKIAVLPRK